MYSAQKFKGQMNCDFSWAYRLANMKLELMLAKALDWWFYRTCRADSDLAQLTSAKRIGVWVAGSKFIYLVCFERIYQEPLTAIWKERLKGDVCITWLTVCMKSHAGTLKFEVLVSEFFGQKQSGRGGYMLRFAKFQLDTATLEFCYRVED